MIKINSVLAQKVLDTVDCGLVKGVGVAEPGKMCIEAAVCYAMGLPHGDEPTCVGSAVRSFKIKLNDADWSSDQSRASGMRKLAVAQLGSDTIDQKEFCKKLAYKTCTILLPDFLSQIDAYGYKENIAALRSAKTLEEARGATSATANAAYDAASVFSRAANAVAYAAYDAVNRSDAYVAYADVAAAACAASTAARATRSDHYLILGADLCLSVLQEMSSPGCQFLSLCS